MKKLIILTVILIQFKLVSAQQFIGSISSGSISKNAPFSVGEVYIEGHLSGQLGVYSFLLAAGLLTEVNDLILEDNFTIFPNPTLGSFEIKSSGKIINDIQVIDRNGKLVKTLSITDQKDISDLIPGIYYIYINQKQVFKILKN